MSIATSPGPYETGERLGTALLIAVLVHGAIIFGVSFTAEERTRENAENLEIVLVQRASEKPPEEARFLGQANQAGGGETELPARPATPLPAPLASRRAQVTAATRPSRPANRVATSRRAHTSPSTRPDQPAPAKPAPKPVLAQTRSPARHQVFTRPTPTPAPKAPPLPKPDRVAKIDPTPVPKPAPPAPRRAAAQTPPTPTTPPQPTETLDAATLVSRSLAMASLTAEIDRKLSSYATRPRHRVISASTREHKFAAYMEAWRIKVERIGNLNYPNEARRRGLSGRLVLDVALSPDGSIQDISLRRSSGERVLDDAAIRIVKLAAPYARFPKAIAAEVDVLHIQRTWRFTSANRFFGD